MKSKRKIFNFILRCLLLVAGLFILAFGIALSAKSGLGVSPVSSTAYVLSLVFPFSMGTFNNLMNLIYMLLQFIVLGRAFRISRLLQLVVVFIFSYFTDFTLELLSPITVNGYGMQLLLSFVSCAVVGLGVFMEMKANVMVMANEGAISVLAEKLGKEFGFFKVLNDCMLVTAAVIISLLAFHKVEGVREGTLIAALLVGIFTQFYKRYLHIFDSICN